MSSGVQLTSDFFWFCRNADGYIDRDEFAEIIRSTGESITEEEIDELLKDGDKNADGMLDFDGTAALFPNDVDEMSRS